MELFSKRLNEIFKMQGKSKKRHSKRPCYKCGETGHFMFNCPNKKNKDYDEKTEENHNKKKNKNKSHKKSQKVQVNIGKEWDSNDSSTDSDDEDVLTRPMAEGRKISSTSKSRNVDEHGKSDSDRDDDLLDDANEITSPSMCDLLETIERKEESVKKQEDLLIFEKREKS
jgi:hypothetical protein